MLFGIGPPIGNGGGGPPGKLPGGGNPPAGGPLPASIGFDDCWPSAAYEEVMLSITDWAFSWPISAGGG